MRHLITAGFLLSALVLYYFGMGDGVAALLVAGIVCELVVWKRLLGRRKT